eukprot:3926126-Pyramimonas_sp.AAC.1
MTGGAEFTKYEEIDVGRFAGSNMNRKPRGVLRVLAVNVASKLVMGDAQAHAHTLVAYMKE